MKNVAVVVGGGGDGPMSMEAVLSLINAVAMADAGLESI